MKYFSEDKDFVNAQCEVFNKRRSLMNNKHFIIIFIISCLILLQANFVFSADDQEILLSGEKLVTSWNEAFAKEVDSVRQFGYEHGWCVERYKLIDGTLGYDIKKTDSLVSPYTLIISLKVLTSDNCSSPNANGSYSKMLKKVHHFKTIEDALNNRLPTDFYPEWTERDIKINYAYQKGKWIFKGGNNNSLLFYESVSNLEENSKFKNLMPTK